MLYDVISDSADGVHCDVPGPPQVLELEMHLLNEEQLPFTEMNPVPGTGSSASPLATVTKPGARRTDTPPLAGLDRRSLQSRCGQDCALPEGSREGAFLPLPASGGPGHLRPVTTSLQSLLCPHILSLLCPCLKSSSVFLL